MKIKLYIPRKEKISYDHWCDLSLYRRMVYYMRPVPILKRYSEHSYTMSDKNEEIEKNVSDQTGVERQRKGVNVEDYPKSVSIGQILKDLEFPADKQKIIQHVQKSSIDNASSSMIGNMFLTATCTYTKIKGAYRYETYLADCRR